MTIIITHGDGDGLCCAAIVKMVPKYHDSQVIISHPMGLANDLLGIDDDLIICDIAIDERTYLQVYELMEEISNSHFVLYIDHHRMPGGLPANIYHDENISATELTYRYFYSMLPSFASHFACIGAICDYLDETPLISELVNEYERRNLYFDAGILAQGLNRYRRSYDVLRIFVEKFSKGIYPNEIKKLVDSAVVISKSDKIARKKVIEMYKTTRYIAYVINPPAAKSKAAHWALGVSSKIIGISIYDHHKSNEMLDMSVRGRNLVDLRDIISDIAMELGGSGGGHSNAVGCRIPAESLELFLKLVDEKLYTLKIKDPASIKQIIESNQIKTR